MESTVRLSTTNNAKIMDDGNQLTDLIDFIIPAGETYNLSKSYVALNMRINARTKKAAGTRECTRNLLETDRHVTKKVMNSMCEQDKNLMKTLLTGSIWTEENFKKTGHIEENKCQFCNTCEIQSTDHLL